MEGFVAERLGLHKGRYGYRRINREPRRGGGAVSEKRALAVMRKLGPQAKGASRKHKRAKAVETGDPRVDLVDRAFDAEARNEPWAGDITCIGTGEGRLYLATATDAFRREAAGRSMPGRMAERLVADALGQAVGREGPPDGFSLVSRDDQGSQHASRAFRRRLEPHGIAQSMSRPGNPWDNALAESLFKTLKREPVNGKGYKTREEAKQDVFKYIELYYNRQRMHSSIGHSAPCDLERDVD
ncbi:IS3 family transposase [Paratractidigestivibacter sp.]|uniref:IS3 family transposase n=1 Tax=Paratractidigestivibacter sp. TaxID=2847316 RepID=UPI003A9309D6